MKTVLLMAMLLVVPMAADASEWMKTNERDTVVIELENGSRIIIYTKNRAELKKLQAYDINEMIADLNKSLADSSVAYLEMENIDGSKYLVESPNIIIGEGESKGDTIVISEKSMDKVKFRIGGMEVTVDTEEEDDDDDDIKNYSSVRRSKRTRHLFNLDIGMNNWMENGNLPSNDNSSYAVKPWGSWYVGINWLNQTKIAGPIYLEWGGGVSWYNWKLEDPDYQFVKGADNVEMIEDPALVGVKSKLSATYLNASLVPMIGSSDGFRIGAGPYAGYRLGSKSKFIFKEEGDIDKIKDHDHFYLENFRYGVRGQLGFRSFDMFVMYDLNNVFVGDKGPEGAKLNAFTIGITL